MKYIYTDLYADFSCVGGSCPSTCCVGWNVFVDKEAYELYSAQKEPLKSKICDNIQEVDNSNGTLYKMRLVQDKRCPFLNKENLCDIYIDLSADAMCRTCRDYPRKRTIYYDTIMATVMTSCPEVVRMILERTEPIVFGFAEDSGVIDTSTADWELYNELINGLVLTTDILQDRRYSFWERLYLVLCLTYQIQEHRDAQSLSVLRRRIECYKDAAYRGEQIETLRQQSGMMAWSFLYSLFAEIKGLIDQMPDVDFQLQDYKVIEKEDEEKYQSWNDNYKRIAKDTQYENLAVEFVFEYYMEALTGKSLFEGIMKMVLLLLVIRTSEVLEYHAQGELTQENQMLLISNISRFMEHSPILHMITERLIKANEREQLFQLAYLFR